MDSPAPKLRILLLGDYSNMHSQLARTLRAMGHSVTLFSDGSGFQDTERDFDVSRRPGKLGGALLAARLMWPWHKHLRGYDVVALQSPHFVELRPRRLRWFFDRLRGENAKVFLTSAGFDPVYIAEALDPHSSLRYNELRMGSLPSPLAVANPGLVKAWMTPEMVSYNHYVYQHVDGVVTALYEYQVAAEHFLGPEKVHYGGIPIDTDALEVYTQPAHPECVRMFLGRHAHRILEKGTDVLARAATAVCERHPGKVALDIVENRPYREYVDMMRGSNIVLDQIYSYTPATNALIAMAHGLTAVSGGEDAYYDFIGECDNRPIVNAPWREDKLVEVLDDLVSNPDDLARRGQSSRDFVVKHNNATTVAKRFLEAWSK